MPDIFDDGPDADAFALPGDNELLANMAAAAGAEPPAAAAPEPALEPAPVAVPTDDDDDPLATEPAAPPPAEERDDDPAADDTVDVEQLDELTREYLGKYDGDPVKALRAAANQADLIGRQGRELGELRKLVEERLPEPEPEPQVQYDQDSLEAYLTEHPTQIPDLAARAYYAGNEQVLNAAISAWEDVDRGAARAFERRIAVLEARRELSVETEQRTATADEWAGVAEKFAESHPDLEAQAPKMRELAAEYPNIVQVLRTGDEGAKLEVLEFLYVQARGQTESDTLGRARTIAREQAHEAEEAIKEAAVASATTVVATPDKSKAQQIAEEWDTAQAPYNDGWNV